MLHIHILQARIKFLISFQSSYVLSFCDSLVYRMISFCDCVAWKTLVSYRYDIITRRFLLSDFFVNVFSHAVFHKLLHVSYYMYFVESRRNELML